MEAIGDIGPGQQSPRHLGTTPPPAVWVPHAQFPLLGVPCTRTERHQCLHQAPCPLQGPLTVGSASEDNRAGQ